MGALPTGRRAADALAQDTTPGKILVLALLANLPILVGPVVILSITKDAEAARRFTPYILYGTPVLAAFSLVLWWRAPPERRAHNAARWGLRLAVAALLLWALALVGETLR